VATRFNLVIDFAGVQVMNISFADEFLGKFLASHDFSAKGTTVKIAGLNADNHLQSYAQGERVWGKAGMKELWGAATVKLIGSGADDADFAEDISRIVGEHDVDVLSYSRGQGGGSSSTSTRRERILPAAAVRALPKSQAVLLATGIKPAMIRLLP